MLDINNNSILGTRSSFCSYCISCVRLDPRTECRRAAMEFDLLLVNIIGNRYLVRYPLPLLSNTVNTYIGVGCGVVY